ncbi:MAG: alpha/beta fold hydrolase [Pseudonocardiaceae bacterium]|nr:alpha/beta fold hydrolase [Pseudonocardiaceae bacterium]
MLALIVALGAGALLWWDDEQGGAPPIRTQNAIIDVRDGPQRDQQNQIEATMYVPARTPAPAILLAHGFGGDKNSVAGEARELAERGFTVLTYSARGFGRSTGRIALNSPDYEVADAQQLIDWLARQPEVRLEAPNNPKLGVSGASYGGALSLMLAGTDDRVDAIAPLITYNDLEQALVPNAATTGSVPNTPAAGAFADDGVFKRAWAGIFFSAGVAGGGGLGSPGGEAPEAGDEEDESGEADPGAAGGAGGTGAGAAQQPPGGAQGNARTPGSSSSCGRFLPEICRAYTELATTGQAGEGTSELLRRISPASVTDNINIPTLLVQGEHDTLFGLDQSDATARQIARAGGEVKTIWYTGGHDGGSPGPALRAKVADWFTARLRDDAPAETGFEYDVQGALRAEGSPSVRTVAARHYPGLSGAGPQRRSIPLGGPVQTVLNPPGGNPAAISSMPGLGGVLSSSSRLADRLAIDVPGQSANFVSDPLDAQLLASGSPRVRLRVSAAPGAPGDASRDAVLFVKLYDVGPDGNRVLPGSAVAPIRVNRLPADGGPVEVTVTLPGIVRPIEAGHRVQLVVATTDQAYANATRPASYRVALAGQRAVDVPVVPGTALSTGVPVGQLLGIAGVLGVALLAGVIGMLRRRRANGTDDQLTDVPLVIENLSKSYPGGLKAVDELSFRVEQGQVLGLLGPNGAGKTTTLRMLMGLVRPTAGTMRVFGHRVTEGAPVLSRIGSFVEGSGFLPHLSGRANLALYWASTGRPAEQAHFTEALEIAGLGDAVHRKVRTYSQGMRQRLAIAQSMLGLPDLLVLDEPTNGLDPPQIHQMREVLRQYAETGRTVLVSSHLLAEVEQTCSHVVVMHRGRLVAEGPVGEIGAGSGEATFRVDQPDSAAEVLAAVEGVTDVHVEGDQVHANLNGTARSDVLSALVRAGIGVQQAGPRRRLEDAFLRLVGEGAGR